MCNYLNESICKVTGKQCPYMYFCTKKQMWRPLSSFPKVCKLKENADIPKGYYKVCKERHGNLYVNIDGYIRIIKNPFDEVPLYVKAYKLKNGEWRLRK